MARLWTILLACCALTALGCAEDDEKEGESPTGGAAAGDDGTQWAEGAYVLTANAVNDGCLDGAANVVAIPNGDSRRFENTLTFPGSDTAFPFTTQLSLVAPFSAAQVVWSKTGDNTYSWAPVANPGVDLGALNDAWMGCTADFSLSGSFVAEVLPDGQVRFIGEVGFGVTATTGDGCPEMTPPCSVDLDLIASKSE